MWWRVELDKQGAILSCAHVEMSGSSRGRIRFVEADSDAQACSRGLSSYRRSLERSRSAAKRMREARRAAGECIRCGIKSAGSLCESCLRLERERAKDLREGADPVRNSYPSEELAAEAHAARVKAGRLRFSDRHKGRPAYELKTLLAKFDSMEHAAFRDYLVERIGSLERAYDANSTRRENARAARFMFSEFQQRKQPRQKGTNQ